MTPLALRYREVQQRIERAAHRQGRSPQDVLLVVVGKGRPVEALSALYDLGHRDFGENRAKELAAKADRLPGDISWHFIGPLQTNKVRLVRPVTTLLHSLDRRSLAEAWMKGPGRPPPALLQINIGREPQKLGIDPDAAAQVVAEFLALGVPLTGLMAIPPLGETPEDSRPYFRRMAEMAGSLRASFPQVASLSMGMTDDFEVAIEEGATVIRLGRAIFPD
ncbi:MAG TPA: YggS family pyridoxal phosphate-dependent enzyme [Acidimicrobiia bacterium]|nr:YggS family pyridoxal phosphate-dependent enzyme [Acidimicrobiia bacterium]